MIRAVVFDMDGVLIDAREWHYESLNKALEVFGYTITRHEHLSTYDGLPTRKKLEMLTTAKGLPREFHDRIYELKQQFTMEIVRRDCRPRPEHLEALSELRYRGYRLAVASNSIRSTVVEMMERAGLDQYLDIMLSNEDVSRPKPSPDIYLKAANMLGTTPDRCLVVEDNTHGVQAAQLSGAHVMVVRGVEDVYLDAILHNISIAEKNMRIAA